ncbi:MAG: transglycosylase SLT domain-containing protein [Byssovorax sp.]
MIGRALRTLGLLTGLVGATGSGCVSLAPSGVVGASCSPNCAPPPPVASTVAVAPLVTSAPAAPEPPPDPNAFDPGKITMVLDDPRLAAVKAEVDREAYAKAAAALQAAIAGAAPLSPEDRVSWLYQLGRLRALGGDPAGSAKAFQEAAASPSPIAAYAHLQAAQQLTGIGQHDAAIAEAGAVTLPMLAAAVDLVMADALLGKKDIDGAAGRFRSYLGRDKHPPQWPTVALRFASALLQRPSEAHAEEAVLLARRVIYESSGGQGAGEAKDLEKQGLSTLSTRRRRPLEQPSAEELLARAKSLVGSGQPRDAVVITDKLVKQPRAKKAGEYACELFLSRSEALVKLRKKPAAADSYGDAIARCEGQPRLVDALFSGGKASASDGRHLEAMGRYARLEKEFPSHRFADDARIKGARAALDAGDEGRFRALLSTIAGDYPNGDLTSDGLFELALASITKRDWASAIPWLERGLARSPRERAYFAAGRFPYYLARAHLETGAVEQGLGELASVIRDYPLSYYMALAYARLGERDRGRAERSLAEAAGAEQGGSFTVPRGPWADDPGFVRAVSLIRQGDAKLAKGELDALGVSARTAPPDETLAVALLLHRSGAIGWAHGFFRTGMNSHTPAANDPVEWLAHYPTGRFRAVWEAAYPRPYASVVGAEARRQSIPEALAYAIMREESAFDPRVVSAAKAVGLMQLIVPTAKNMAAPLGLPWDEEALKRPEVNIALGCRYLSVLRGQFPDDPLLAIPGYNAGGGAPKKWIAQRPTDDFDFWVERIPYEETRQYTKRVITSMAAYEMLYTRELGSEARSTPLAVSASARAGAIP